MSLILLNDVMEKYNFLKSKKVHMENAITLINVILTIPSPTANNLAIFRGRFCDGLLLFCVVGASTLAVHRE